jgi:uncharacterized cupredoxin-like copper-binding protein
MKKTIVTLALAVAGLSAWSTWAASHDNHHHQSYAAGEPGNPGKPSRTVEVRMSEMEYRPAQIEVKRGEQIRFVIHNAGADDHEFLLASTEENLKHAEEMKAQPHMSHDDPNAVRLMPTKSAEIVWRFTRPGTFEYACLIPGHREGGMIGRIVVK